jgi:hypothetical protein
VISTHLVFVEMEAVWGVAKTRFHNDPTNSSLGVFLAYIDANHLGVILIANFMDVPKNENSLYNAVHSAIRSHDPPFLNLVELSSWAGFVLSRTILGIEKALSKLSTVLTGFWPLALCPGGWPSLSPAIIPKMGLPHPSRAFCGGVGLSREL